MPAEPPGSFYTEPPSTNHFAMTKSDEVEELGGQRMHMDIMLQFLEEGGITREQADMAEAAPGTLARSSAAVSAARRAVSRAPLAKLQTYKRRMGWTFPWASSFADFNSDFNVWFTQEQQQSLIVEYNFRTMDVRSSLRAGKDNPIAQVAAGLGTDLATYTREAPGMSAFALEYSEWP